MIRRPRPQDGRALLLARRELLSTSPIARERARAELDRIRPITPIGPDLEPERPRMGVASLSAEAQADRAEQLARSLPRYVLGVLVKFYEETPMHPLTGQDWKKALPRLAREGIAEDARGGDYRLTEFGRLVWRAARRLRS